MTQYRGHRASLATRHSKERVIAPRFAVILGMDVFPVEVDTDTFGTFAGDIPRTGSALETATRKARAGMELTGRPIGMASEGTITGDPLLPGGATDTEVIVFVDDERGIVVHHTHRSPTIVAFQRTLTPGADLDTELRAAHFPEHGLIARPDGLPVPITKGITDRDTLTRVMREYAPLSPTGRVLLESDFRAHMSPTRMQVIDECARMLAERLARPCPNCGSPGWGEVEPAWGLPCRECGTTVPHVIRADQWGCPACPHREERSRAVSAEARWCPRCNP